MTEDIQFLSNDDLDNLYAPPSPMITGAVKDHLTDFHIQYLERATFFCIATSDENGLDASPRGGDAGLVKLLNRKTVCFADWPGNNRISALRSIAKNGRAGLLFIFPGLDVFMRINGRAGVTTDERVIETLLEGKRRPKSAVVVMVEEVLFHCGKAANRAGLWKADAIIDRKSLPSPGTMMKELAKLPDDVPSEALDEMYYNSMKHGLYGEED